MTNIGLVALPSIPILTIWALAWLFLGQRLESWDVALSVLLFSLAAGWSFLGRPSFWLLLLGKQKSRDATALALLGPDIFLNVLVLCITLLAVFFALTGYTKLSYAADIVAFATFSIGTVFLHIAQGAVADGDAQRSMHLAWYEDFQALAASTSDYGVRTQLQALAERCRYAASDAGDGGPQNAVISQALASLPKLLSADSAELQIAITNISDQLVKREHLLRAVRTKA